eukprot:1293281-Amorphochlora_amoeboformis.AAC.1
MHIRRSASTPELYMGHSLRQPFEVNLKFLETEDRSRGDKLQHKMRGDGKGDREEIEDRLRRC